MLVGFALGYSACTDQKTQNRPDKASADPVVVEVQTVSEEIRMESRRLNGDVMPWSVIPLLFKVGGRIKQLPIEEGQMIAVNQFIGALDTRDYRLVRDLADAQVSALSPHLDRALVLKDANVVPQAQLDELNGRMGVAKVQKSQAEAQLSYARLNSPVAGVLLQKKANIGEMTDPEHPVGLVAEMVRVKVVLPVSQRDLPFFKVGDIITLSTPELPQSFTGTVYAVGFAAEERTRTFPVTLEVANPELRLRAGMIVEAELKVGEHRGIFIPLDAVTRSLSGIPVAMVVDEKRGVAAPKSLKLGVVLGEKAQVLSGLIPGDKVIVRGIVGENDPVVVQ